MVRVWSSRRRSLSVVGAGSRRGPLVATAGPTCIADTVADRAAVPGLVGSFMNAVSARPVSRAVNKAQPQSPAAVTTHEFVASGGVTGRKQRRAALLGSVAS